MLQAFQKESARTSLWIIFFLVIFFIAGFSFSLQFFQRKLEQTDRVGPTLQSIQRLGEMVMGVDPLFPPMEYLDDKGNLVGFDIDLGERMGSELGIEATFIKLPFDKLFDALDQRKIDFILSSVVISEERKRMYNFSEPYLTVDQVFITTKDNTSINSDAGLRGKKIGVRKGSMGSHAAFQYALYESVISYTNFADGISALMAGVIDALIMDLPVAKFIVYRNPDVKITGDPFAPESYGLVFRRGEPDLVEKFNALLHVLGQKGFMAGIKQKWLQ